MKNFVLTQYNRKSFDPIVLLLCVYLVLFCTTSNGQDLEGFTQRTLTNIKESPLKISGGIAANSVFYSSSGADSRADFTYFLQGNVNIGWLSFNMPLSYSFSNQGHQLNYESPFKFNRISLHPKYKWIQGHLGDVAMRFSPYTLDGHQFTGVGLELTPKESLTIKAMGGRLLKAVEEDVEQQVSAHYRRMGYGLQLQWQKELYTIGFTSFYAKDDVNSIQTTSSSELKPKENLALSWDGEVTIASLYKIYASYASSAMTTDVMALETDSGTGLASLFFNNRESTSYFDAFKTGLDLELEYLTLGVLYERIEPGYETLGAYFFNNDLEQISLEASKPLFNKKLDLSFQIGFQRDDLNNRNAQRTNRILASVNANYTVNDRITLSGSYSNFSTYTNRNLNQFDDLNDTDLTDNDLEILNYRQLSQNAGLSLNWTLKEGEVNAQKIVFNYDLASSANEQNGIIHIGQVSNFHNGNAAYTLALSSLAMHMTTGLNFTYSDVGREDSKAYGGTLSVQKKLWKDKLDASFGMIYTSNRTTTQRTNLLNFPIGISSIIRERHQFGFQTISSFKSHSGQNQQELTITLGYNYSF